MTPTANDLFSRNWAFISPELQRKLDQTCIFFAGVGLNSTIALLACRTGFGKFILADGDAAELSNLNRQAFFRRHIGQNKATATAELLREIRPDVEVTIIPEFIEGDSYFASLDHTQLIVNSIDYDNPSLFGLARDARDRGIPMLVPLDLGWGGAATIFTADSMPLEAYLGIDPQGMSTRAPSERLDGTAVSAQLVTRAFAGGGHGVPPYLAETLADFQVHGAEWPCEPQLGPAASLTAAMVVRAATALVAGDPVRLAPAVYHIDLRSTLEPATKPDVADTSAVAVTPAPETAQGPNRRATGGPAVQKMPTQKRNDDDFRVYLRSRQQSARYPALMALATKARNLLYLRNRPTGLWAYAIRHDQLTAEALDEFGEFRIDQYALAGLYDTTKIAQRGYRTDPSLASVSANTIHVLCGSSAGQILSCCSIVPPKGSLFSEPMGRLVKRRRPLVLADEERAVFPSETELFGRGVFESLPAIQEIPIERIREPERMMRNQAINSPLTSLAVFEVCFALTEVLTNPKLGIDLALGNAGPEARNLMEIMKIPMLYAPWASVVVDETLPGEDFWIAPPNAEGYFWPFIISTVDLRALASFRQQLDQALGSPAQSARNALIQVASLAEPPGQPQFVIQAQMPPRWFLSPPYGPAVPAAGQPTDQPTDQSTAQPAVQPTI
jgi:molybdopterin/thiamine biosynthesis adenylyltransferase